MILRILKLIGRGLLYFILCVVLIFYFNYITCPVYQFENASVFNGDIFYNPYTDIDSSHWRKANFQVQSHAWMGLTSGRNNTNEAIYDVYRSMGYDIVATSDYQKINKFRNKQPDFIAVYEHGYGIKKSHQVLLGSQKVLWLDYPLFQTLHNKQHILNQLRKDNDLIYLAHPKLVSGYTLNDLKLLRNYDGIEVLNNNQTSIEYWDAALSSGNYKTILGNDDAHDISNPMDLGHHCTFVNSETIAKNDILNSLKSGKAFGAKVYRKGGETINEKIKRIRILPVLISVKISGDTLKVRTDSIAKEIRFIGQEGKLMESVTHANKSYYLFKNSDTYIRIEIEFYSGHIYYLNPVCRTINGLPPTLSVPKVDLYKTYLLRIVGFSTLAFILFNFFYLKTRLNRKKQN